jgi:hypothetical protein
MQKMPQMVAPMFDSATHTYRDANGNIFPSVTQVLRASGLMPDIPISEERKKAAQDRGNNIHWLYCLDNQQALNTRRLNTTMRGYLKSWRAWKKDAGFFVIKDIVEFAFISAEYGFAGTVDVGGMLQGFPAVVDYKSGAAIPEYVRWQLAPYAVGAFGKKAKFTRRICFQPRPDANPPYRVREFPTTEFQQDWAKFAAALQKVKGDYGANR